MKKFNKSKVIIPALAMIALTTAASATGTVAWFAANTSVNVSGMQMTATAGSNLLIAKDVISSTAAVAESNFGPAISQTVSADIKPVSTINGKNFFYTNNALATGAAVSGATFEEVNVDVDDTTNYGKIKNTSNIGFLEYVFQLKAINSATNTQNINLTALNLTYTPTTTAEKTSAEAIHAYRAAFFIQELTKEAFTKGPGTLNAIYAQVGFDHFNKENTDCKAIKAYDGSTQPGTVTYDKVTYASSATPLATVASGSTKYFKVVVRAYLEGEDKSCNNAQFLGVTAGWSLGLSFDLSNNASTVSAINTTVSAATNPNN